MPSSSSELSFPDPLPESEAFLLGSMQAKIDGLGYHNPNIKGWLYQAVNDCGVVASVGPKSDFGARISAEVSGQERLKLLVHKYNDVRLGMSECEESGVKNMGDVFKLAKEALSKKGELDAMEPPTNVIKSKLFQYQKEGLRWLVDWAMLDRSH
ncbi:hypothetical protein QQ045_015905 [Rhodiola kirilowii]